MQVCKFFPSGRSVDQVRNDAKRLSKTEGIPLTEALNRLSVMNGVGPSWSESMALMRQCNNLAEVVADAVLGGDIYRDLFEEFGEGDESAAVSCRYCTILSIGSNGETFRVFGSELEALEQGFHNIFERSSVGNQGGYGEDDGEFYYWETYRVWLLRDGSGFYVRGQNEYWDILTPEFPLGAENVHASAAHDVCRRVMDIYQRVLNPSRRIVRGRIPL